jgi:hypothetical protein
MHDPYLSSSFGHSLDLVLDRLRRRERQKEVPKSSFLLQRLKLRRPVGQSNKFYGESLIKSMAHFAMKPIGYIFYLKKLKNCLYCYVAFDSQKLSKVVIQ